MKTLYPWNRLQNDEWFFVPSLDPETTRREGLLAAVALPFNVHATIGVYQGRYGVLFSRVPPARRKRTPSERAEAAAKSRAWSRGPWLKPARRPPSD